MKRRDFVGGVTGATLALGGDARAANMAEHVTAETDKGQVEGTVVEGVLVFRSVPYARAARFRPPEALAPWRGRLDAISRGPICPQSPERLAFVTGAMSASTPQSEDCQNLTVTTPALKGRRPVMIWFHGGAYMAGGGELPHYDAHKLSTEGGVVVVSVSYRLGVFGWLWHEDMARRNLGLQDQLAALDWVAANIERFGGDPDNLTVFGQSAGGGSIVAMLQVRDRLPFRRAILQSTAIAARRNPEDAAAFADAFHAALGVDPETAPISAILAAQRQAVVTNTVGIAPMSPVLEPHRLQRSGLDCLVGWNRDDGSPFIAMRNPRAVTDSWFQGSQGASTKAFTNDVQAKPALTFAKSTPAAAKTYLYRLDLRPKGSPFGACHCLELPLLLGHEATWRDAPMLGVEPWTKLEALGRRLRATWAAFARTGDPRTDGDWEWRAYSGETAGTVTSVGA